MIGELLLCFVLGGVIVSAFAALGELFEPKTFSGLFGAAPSVAIATPSIAFVEENGAYVGTEARSMLLGFAALFVYSAACIATTDRECIPVWVGAVLGWAMWAAVAFTGWLLLFHAGTER
jgi:hypothetical protein